AADAEMIYALFIRAPLLQRSAILTKSWQFFVTGLLLQRPSKMGMIDQNICQPNTATRSEQRRGDNPRLHTGNSSDLFFGSLD
ncbi:hypothetical protein ABTD90_20365, partial [Acinetobacter baumannii]